MRKVIVLFSLVTLIIFSRCTSRNEDLKEALGRSLLIVEESTQLAQVQIAALNAENPAKMERFYSYSILVDRAHKEAINQLDSCENSRLMLLVYEEFLTELKNFPEDELGAQIQLNVQFQNLTEIEDVDLMRLIIKSEMQNIEFRILDELSNSVTGPSIIFWYSGLPAYHKGDSTYVELLRYTPLILQENIKNFKVKRNEMDLNLEFAYRPIQEAKSVFVFKRLPPGEYEFTARAYFEQDDGWVDFKPIYSRFTIKD